MPSPAIGFTGTQAGVSPERIEKFRAFMADAADKGWVVFRHGDCIGADAQAHKVARSLKYYIIGHLPEYDGKRAFCHFDETWIPKPYMVRNQDIVDNSQILVALPKDPDHEELRSGTWSTIRKARKAGKKVFIF